MTSELVAYDRDRTYMDEPSTVPLESGAGRLTIHHILAPLDGSSLAECTLPFVAAMATAFAARVTLVRVLESVESAPIVDAVEFELARAEAYAHLAGLEAGLKSRGISTAIEIVPGKAAEQVPHFAKTHNADLVVLSTHGAGGLQIWNLGGTVQKVIATTDASVLIVPAQRSTTAPAQFRKILLPLDCSQRAECILPAAIALAEAHRAEMILAHVVREPEVPRRLLPSSEDVDLAEKLIAGNRSEAKRYLRDIQNRLAAMTGRVEVRLVVSPHPVQVLRELVTQEQVDLIVLSAHGSTGDPKQRYGSVASQLLHEGGKPAIVLQDLDVIQPSAAPNNLGQERQVH